MANQLGGLATLGLNSAEARKVAVWRKGRPIPNYDDKVWRWDTHGKVICYSDYGKADSPYGWQIDHILPTALGGSDDIGNLRPLHCQTNAGLGGILSGILGN
jgi:HNH endonuclease